jgi:hypothetical protein
MYLSIVITLSAMNAMTLLAAGEIDHLRMANIACR